jgi:hypothetical protein
LSFFPESSIGLILDFLFLKLNRIFLTIIFSLLIIIL